MATLKDIITAAIIKDGKILLADNHGNWVLPGGTKESGESDSDCLKREFREEFAGSKLEPRDYYMELESTSPRQKDPIRVHVYLADIVGEFYEPDGTDEDIKQARWVSYDEISKYNMPDTARQVIESLKQGGFFS